MGHQSAGLHLLIRLLVSSLSARGAGEGILERGYAPVIRASKDGSFFGDYIRVEECLEEFVVPFMIEPLPADWDWGDPVGRTSLDGETVLASQKQRHLGTSEARCYLPSGLSRTLPNLEEIWSGWMSICDVLQPEGHVGAKSNGQNLFEGRTDILCLIRELAMFRGGDDAWRVTIRANCRREKRSDLRASCIVGMEQAWFRVAKLEERRYKYTRECPNGQKFSGCETTHHVVEPSAAAAVSCAKGHG
ncbi:hypothetical protein PAXRUDRAFT_26963 [Paxillus rubicundulus Ve08.2h10]|uniref:Uncharacterized protein n=1 Tax=Paxillus rubicundulus Ve08.2h10 TaxID=930991 RepID=A0A0D0DYG2_9AGAM|nr:hypothetical protein PAXRUDRAFT_26963 [Paxillus rubicundulus Ve08.2h10]